MRLWSQLEPWERRAELAKVHPDLTDEVLILDGLDVPELKPQIEAQETDEDKLRIVLRYFGDEGNPQPTDRTEWVEGIFTGVNGLDTTSPTPAWGRLPHREADVPTVEIASADTTSSATRGAKSRWRRADLETIIVKRPDMSARKLATSGLLVEPIRHQRTSELRRRGDVGVDERGRLALPAGTTADGGWITLPKRG